MSEKCMATSPARSDNEVKPDTAPLTTNDKLLVFCQQQSGVPSEIFIVFMMICTFGLAIPFLILGYLNYRITALSEDKVHELTKLLQSEEELRIGREIYAKRNGVVYPRDLSRLEQHLLSEAERTRKQECLNKLGLA
jgi:hypothetical protein